LFKSDYALVRVGRKESMHPDCEQISLDYLTNKKTKDSLYDGLKQRSTSLLSQLQQFETIEKKLIIKLELAKNGSNKCMINDCEQNLKDLKRKKNKLENQLKKVSGPRVLT
jgi:hypothetical protein